MRTPKGGSLASGPCSTRSRPIRSRRKPISVRPTRPGLKAVARRIRARYSRTGLRSRQPPVWSPCRIPALQASSLLPLRYRVPRPSRKTPIKMDSPNKGYSYRGLRDRLFASGQDVSWPRCDGRELPRPRPSPWKGFSSSARYPETMDLRALVDRDISLTERALGKAKIAVPERSHLRKVAEDFVTMARAYYADANHFRDAGELDKALANINYAHGWLDAGARLGLFDVGGDDQLFTLSE